VSGIKPQHFWCAERLRNRLPGGGGLLRSLISQLTILVLLTQNLKLKNLFCKNIVFLKENKKKFKNKENINNIINLKNVKF
jgi:hypothetical protein